MLTIDVISDVICPWCFIGKRRLEKALDGRSAPVRWHPFQLNPDMPREGIDRKSYRIRKFGSWERSQELDAQVGAAGPGEGIAFNPDKMARTPNTLDAHRVIWLAGERGVQDAVVEALFLAYFTDGRDLTDRATLAEIAAGAGLDRAEVEELLVGHKGLDAVRAGGSRRAASACLASRSSWSTGRLPCLAPSRRSCSFRRSSRRVRRSWPGRPARSPQRLGKREC